MPRPNWARYDRQYHPHEIGKVTSVIFPTDHSSLEKITLGAQYITDKNNCRSDEEFV